MFRRRSVDIFYWAVLIIFFILAISHLIFGVFTLSVSYLDFIQLITEKYNLSGREDKLMSIITEERFLVIRIITFFFTLIFTLTTFFLYKKVADVKRLIYQLLNQVNVVFTTFKHTLDNLSTFQKVTFYTLFILIIVSRFYYATVLPIHIDTAFSYTFFVSKGFLITSTYYPGPNNHVFYNLLCNVFDFGLLPAEWVMRMPTILASFVLALIMFVGLKIMYSSSFLLHIR